MAWAESADSDHGADGMLNFAPRRLPTVERLTRPLESAKIVSCEVNLGKLL